MNTIDDFKMLRKRVPLESDVLRAILQYLRLHKDVAWVARMNTGAMEVQGRYVKFAFKGCSDIIGQMRDGRFLAVEVKRPGKIPSANQDSFLRMVNQHGGLAFWADDVFTVEEKLK